MAERTVDPTRQGIASPSPDPLMPQSAPPVSAAEAQAAVDGWAPDMPRFGLHRIAEALASECERLRFARRRWANRYRLGRKGLALGDAELVRIRAALPEIIGCAHGDVAGCTRTWFSCCVFRKRCVEHGLLPRPERRDEEGDGE